MLLERNLFYIDEFGVVVVGMLYILVLVGLIDCMVYVRMSFGFIEIIVKVIDYKIKKWEECRVELM